MSAQSLPGYADPYTNLQGYLRRIRQHQELADPFILHYSSASYDLRPWLWPVNDSGERVTPEGLSNYRASHHFRNPCCLCAALSNDDTYTEAAIFKAFEGEFIGEFMAGCAEGTCGYLICMERIYARPGLPLKRFRIRDADTPAPAPVIHTPSIRHVVANMSVAMPKNQATRSKIFKIIPKCNPPIQPAESIFEKLVRLDSWTRPGLSKVDFQDLFVECRRCHWIMTKGAFQFHDKCVLAGPKSHPCVIQVDPMVEDSDSD